MMLEFGGAKIFTGVFLLFCAILPNQVELTRVEAPYVVFQIQLLGRIMYFCPEKPDKADCGRWVRETAFGATAFVQPSGANQWIAIENVEEIPTH